MLKNLCRSAVIATASLSASLAAAPQSETPLAIKAADSKLKWGACPPVFPQGCQIAVLHGDPGRPNADVFLRVPGGYAIPPHRHTSAERMILVTGQMRVKYEGVQAATLAPGNYAYGPANQAHRATCLGRQACTLFIAFEGPVDAEAVQGPLD